MGLSDKLAAIADEIESHPERWTQGTLARNANGQPMAYNSSEAVCWCALGFRMKHGLSMSVDVVLNTAAQLLAASDYITYNDVRGRKPEDVVRMFREAARMARPLGGM